MSENKLDFKSSTSCGPLARKHSVLVAISQGRSHTSEMGMVSLALETNECTMTQFGDSPSFMNMITRLSWLNPSHVRRYNRDSDACCFGKPPFKTVHVGRAEPKTGRNYTCF
jgi:hypothetical protein